MFLHQKVFKDLHGFNLTLSPSSSVSSLSAGGCGDLTLVEKRQMIFIKGHKSVEIPHLGQIHHFSTQTLFYFLLF